MRADPAMLSSASRVTLRPATAPETVNNRLSIAPAGSTPASALRIAVIGEFRRVFSFDCYVWVLTDPESCVGSDPLAEVPGVRDLASAIRLKYATSVNRWTTLTDVAVLEFAIREDLSRHALRRLAVLRPLKVVIENYPEGHVEELEAVEELDVAGVEVVGLEERAAEEPRLAGVVQPTSEKAKSAETRRTFFLIMC